MAMDCLMCEWGIAKVVTDEGGECALGLVCINPRSERFGLDVKMTDTCNAWRIDDSATEFPICLDEEIDNGIAS